jgi:hypothetical protein
VPGEKLGSDTEDRMNELALRNSIALGDPADLTFADCMHRLVALDSSARALHRSESEACANPLLDEAMVLLDDVVQIGRSSAPTTSSEFTGLLQFGNRADAGCPSTLITRGRGPPPESAKRRNNFAAIRSRFGDNMNSIVSPAESTARYR